MAGEGAKVIETLIVKELRAEKFGLGKAAAAPTRTFAVTNHSEDVAMDCNAAADAEICDVLGSLIAELITLGVISGSVA